MSGLGIYDDGTQLDHDVEDLLAEVVSQLISRGVDFTTATAAVKRCARSDFYR
jgi:hypothetical protein